MKKTLLVIALIWSAPALADLAVEIPLTIQLPTENVDGSPLTDLDSVQLHYGYSSGSYTGQIVLTPVPNQPSAGETIQWTLALSVPNNTIVFVTSTATDTEGNVSTYGNEVSHGPFVQVDDVAPASPTLQSGQPVITNCPPGWRCEVQ